MISLFTRYFLKFLKYSFFMILLILPIVILSAYYPSIGVGLHREVVKHAAFLTGFRWGLIFLFFVSWSYWVNLFSRKYQWKNEKRDFWVSQRFRLTGWIIVFELLICENILAVLF